MNAVTMAPPVRINEYYELRLYRMVPTRMPGFHDLMGGQVPPLFARNGIPRPLGIWEGQAGPLAPLYAYILPWANLDDRMKAWKSFYADTDWKAQLAANYAGLQRVERSHVFILRPSPVWADLREAGADGPVGGVHEIRIHDVLNEDPTLAHRALRDVDLPFMRARGGRVLGVFATWFGTRMNQAVTIMAWPDGNALLEASRAHQTDAGILAARDAERRAHGRPLLRGTDVHVLRPVAYGAAHANLSPRP